MLFPTVDFAIFFVLVFILSWLLKGRSTGRKIFLVIASYFFYAYWDYRFTLLLFTCSIGNYLFGRLIGKTKKSSPRKLILIFAIIFNLSGLIFFKYYGFFAVSLNNLLLILGLSSQLPLLSLILPVGISFFTFQAMSYVISVYRGEIPACRAVIDILLYISFFPQLVAGPIIRASAFLPQLRRRAAIESIPVPGALLLIMAGLFKKVVIAHYLATLLVDEVFANPSLFSSLELLLAVYGYAVQIYCDFSAYSDIAIGTASLLGFNFSRNFDHPYRAESLQDFWRRWHISLSTWLRDYLYIPLGGSKKGRFTMLRNLMVTMLLGGLWHGAAWNFVIWGALHGIVLCAERFLRRRPQSGVGLRRDKSPPAATPILRALSVFFTFHFVCLGWIFFRAGSFSAAIQYLSAFCNLDRPVILLSPFIVVLIAFGMAVHFIPQSVSIAIKNVYNRLHIALAGLIFGIFLVLLGAVSPEGVAPFIYFQF